MARGAVEGLDAKEQPNSGGERAERGLRNVEAPELVGLGPAEMKGALEAYGAADEGWL